MRNNADFAIALGLEKIHRQLQALRRFRKRGSVSRCLGGIVQHRHLHRQRGVAAVRQLAAQYADQAPVGMDAHPMHDHQRRSGILGRGVER